jgi:hypothetical protein
VAVCGLWEADGGPAALGVLVFEIDRLRDVDNVTPNRPRRTARLDGLGSAGDALADTWFPQITLVKRAASESHHPAVFGITPGTWFAGSPTGMMVKTTPGGACITCGCVVGSTGETLGMGVKRPMCRLSKVHPTAAVQQSALSTVNIKLGIARLHLGRQ